MAQKRTVELEVTSNVKPLKSQLKEAVVELQKMVSLYGEQSEQAVLAAKRAAELKDQIEDTNDLLKTYKGEGTFIAMGKAMSSVAAGFSAVEGGFALIGVEGEAVQETMLKVQAAMALTQGLEGLEDAGRAFSTLGTKIRDTAIKLGILTVSKEADVVVSAQQTASTVGNVIATEAQAGANVVAGASFKTMGTAAKVSLNGIKGAIAATGIGLLVVALGVIVAYWDDIKAAVGGVTAEMNNNLEIATKNAEESKRESDNFKYQENSLKLQGKSEKEILQIRMQKQQASLKDAKAQLQAQITIQKASESASIRNFNLAKQILNALGTIGNLIPLGIAKAIDGISYGIISLAKMTNKYMQQFQGLMIGLLTQPIEIALKGANQISKALGLGTINVKSIMGDITDIAKATTKGVNQAIQGLKGTNLADALQGGTSLMADYGAGLIFNTKAIKEEGKKSLEAMQDNVLQIESEIAGGKLQIKEIEKKANEDSAKSGDDAQKAKEEKLKEYNERLKAFYDAQEADRQSRITDAQEKELQELANKFETSIDIAEKAGQDTVAITKQYQADVIATKEKYRLIDEQQMLEANAKAQAFEIKAKLDFDAQIEAIDEQNYQASLTEQEREISAVREKYFALEELAKGNADAEKSIKEAKERELAAIDKKHTDSEKQRKAEALNKYLDLAKGQFNALGDLAMAFNAQSKEGQKRAFNVKKGADIASATIDTFKSAQMAYTSMVGIPVVGPALGVAAAGMAVATGLLNIKKIASQKFEGGGSVTGGGGSAGGVGGGAGGGMSGGAQAPSFNVVGNNGLNQLAQLQQQPMQAFVVSGEVSSAQSLDRNRIQNASI